MVACVGDPTCGERWHHKSTDYAGGVPQPGDASYPSDSATVARTVCREAAVWEVQGMAATTPAIRLTVEMLLTLTLVNAATARAQIPTADTTPAAATPDAAVRQVVASRGHAYAGACAATRSPEDRGADCATFVAERGGVRAYLIGRILSEYSESVFVAQQGGGWRVVGTAPLEFFESLDRIPWPR
jgi:hypothetical protein